MYNGRMFSGETMEELFSAAAEVTNTTGQRKAEIASAEDTGMKELFGFPVQIDPTLPRGQIQVRYTDAVGRQHIVKAVDVSDELEAIEAASKAKRIGPQTAPEMLADYEYRKRLDDELVRDSRAAFERGEITEDEIYEGNPWLSRGHYPLVFESRVREQAVAAWIPLSVRAIEEEPRLIDKMAEPQARHIIQREALKFLRARK